MSNELVIKQLEKELVRLKESIAKANYYSVTYTILSDRITNLEYRLRKLKAKDAATKVL